MLEKAAQDEFTVDSLLPLSESSDEVIGFHLQQAAEKLLKALLTQRRIEYRRTHNLGEFIYLLNKHNETLPLEFDSIRELTPYAADWRYDFLPEEGKVDLDRFRFREMVRKLSLWVEERVGLK